jgi:hypothetical protein
MFSEEGGIGTISSSSSVRRTRSSRGDFFGLAGAFARAALAGGAEREVAALAFAGLVVLAAARLAGLAAFEVLAGLAGLARRATLARLADRLVGRLAERFAGFDLGREADPRLRAEGAGFFRRVAFALAMTRPFRTLTVCR